MCPIVPTFTCGLLRSNFSFAINSFSSRNATTALQKSLPPARSRSIRVFLRGDHFPRLESTRPPACFCVVLNQTFVNISRDSDVVFPSRNTAEHVQKVLQKPWSR